jgi:hypothetical protein
VPDLAFSVTAADIVSFPTAGGVRRAVRTDGALDRGNSGGPALTAQGQVAGVVTEMDLNASGLQLVALLYTADALAGEVESILDAPGSVEPACDADREVLPPEWFEDYQATPAAERPDGYGDDPELDELHDACAGGDLQACDELYVSSPYGSAYESFGASCGRRTEGSYGTCAGSTPQQAPEPVPADRPDDATERSSLAPLRSACAEGDDEACDQLYWQSPAGTSDESFGATCGGRAVSTAGGCSGRDPGAG